mgnify:CR=1 FL=1
MENYNRKRIAVIEDNELIREGFVALIADSSDYEVCGAYGSCEEGLRHLVRDVPDLVLMDIDLPGMDGIEGTLQFKRLWPECIVLIITVIEDSEKVFRSLCAGAGGYIVKNSDTEQIVASIAEAFAGGAPMSLSIAKMVVQSFKRATDSPLSEREREVLRGIAEGKSYSKIALDLFISRETVRSHIKNIYQKLQVNNKAEAIRVAGGNRWFG